MTNRADDIKDKQITSIKLAEDKFKEQLGYYSLIELNNLKKEFEACRDIAVDGFTDESVDVQYNNKSKLKLILKFDPKTIEEQLNEIKEGVDNEDNTHDEMSLRLVRSSGEQDCRCCDCWHYQYDHYSDGDWFRYCIFEDRTKKLPNNPHAEYEKWFCPYFDEDDYDYSQIYEIYEAWESGNDR